ncbi:hypothetical protein J6590_025131 [Homalodisca vitripennis]|nr:hypothetical protein J6590_025131 [Homalodisca vitripennis]
MSPRVIWEKFMQKSLGVVLGVARSLINHMFLTVYDHEFRSERFQHENSDWNAASHVACNGFSHEQIYFHVGYYTRFIVFSRSKD